MTPNSLNSSVHGWLILDKPLGLTSTQALGKVRRLVGGKKGGHAGTLDPLASGVLPLAFGEATKVVPYVQDGEKEYEFTVRWGLKRSTDDAEGEVTAQSPERPDEEHIFMALSSFVGRIMQTPPAYSAIKIDGKRAYDLARAGKEPEMKSRPVTIHALDLVKMIDRDHASFRVACGKGTYVRALARDLAEDLGTYGHLTALRRTKVGRFSVENAISLEKLEELSHNGAANTALLDVGSALDDIPGLILSDSEAQHLRAGQSLLIRPDQKNLMEAPVIMARHRGVPIALVKAEAGSFCVVRGFNF
jgi:tRNA pseudouridine55 synthase